MRFRINTDPIGIGRLRIFQCFGRQLTGFHQQHVQRIIDIQRTNSAIVKDGEPFSIPGALPIKLAAIDAADQLRSFRIIIA